MGRAAALTAVNPALTTVYAPTTLKVGHVDMEDHRAFHRLAETVVNDMVKAG